MFKIGDIVVYGAQGICKISNVEIKQLGKTAMDYYVLNPIFNENTALFVPVDNEKLTAKMQNILTVAQANDIIKNVSKTNVIKNETLAAKQEQYREILSSGDRQKLLSLIKTIRVEREERAAVSKKLSMSDEQMLYKAEQLLFNELAYVLGAETTEIKDKIKF